MYKQFCFKIKLLIKMDPGFYCNSFIVNLKYLIVNALLLL